MSVAPAPLPRPPLPVGWRLRADPSLRRLDGGRALLGGSPLRALRLSDTGARTVGQWLAGAPVGESTAELALARRLLDAGLAQPDPPRTDPTLEGAVTVVVPTHGRAEALRRCLASLPRGVRVVVVDDGSPAPCPVAAVVDAAGAELLRLHARAGPGAARNAGLTAARTPLVAFVDSDCVLRPGTLRRLSAQMEDPLLAAIAPRLLALTPRQSLLGAFETHRSALDMGARGGLAAPGTAVPYVPSAVLVARVAALGHGFDEDLAVGEDVDLAWRLVAAGWQVRYDPCVTAAHDHRARPWPWFTRRIAYDTASAPLARRHPGNLPTLVLSRGSALTWTALLLGHASVAAAASVASAAGLRTRLAPRLPGAGPLAARLITARRLHDGRDLARALAGPWLPFALLAARRDPALGRRMATLVAVGIVLEWAEDPHEPSPLHLAPPRLAAGLARGIGVWAGCLRARTVAPLALRVGPGGFGRPPVVESSNPPCPPRRRRRYRGRSRTNEEGVGHD